MEVLRSDPDRADVPPTAVIDYRGLVEGSAGVTTVTSADGVYLYVSPVVRRLFGWDAADMEGRAEVDFVHPDDRLSLSAGRAALADIDFVTTSCRFVCRDGSHCWTETTSWRVDAESSAVVVSEVRDITERQARTTSLERQAFSDPLTGVANRTVLMDRLHQGLRRLGRSGGVLGVLYLDLDRFKVVNDSLGHRVGDAVLVQMAETAHASPPPGRHAGPAGG